MNQARGLDSFICVESSFVMIEEEIGFKLSTGASDDEMISLTVEDIVRL